MGKQKNHPIYSQDATVTLESGVDRFDALQRAIVTSGFLENVESVFAGSGKPREEFLIAIKPNIMTASRQLDPNPVYTDPQLVEYLIDRLRDKGFRNIAVVEARNVYDYSYQGRSVHAVAEMLGYTGRTYRIEDLSEQKEPYDYGSVLGQHYVGRTWRDADYRISFAKNKTHWQCLYTGCLKNVYGCLPEADKMLHYHGKRREFYECCILILDRFPVHFGFLDAWISGDGFSGHVRDAKPNLTRTIFASENVFALDWVMGEKMEINPFRFSPIRYSLISLDWVMGEKMEINPAQNYVIQEAMYRWGTIQITRKGNMTPWHPWTNIRPFVVMALDAMEEAYWTSRFFSRAFASEQDSRFPPVSRWQILYGFLQKITGLFERFIVIKTQ